MQKLYYNPLTNWKIVTQKMDLWSRKSCLIRLTLLEKKVTYGISLLNNELTTFDNPLGVDFPEIQFHMVSSPITLEQSELTDMESFLQGISGGVDR